MKTHSGSLLLLPLLLCSCGVFNHGDFPAKASRKESSAYSVARGGRVEISNFNGAIRVGRSSGNEVQIERITTCRARSDEEAASGLDLIVPEVLSGMDFFTLKLSDPRSSRRQWMVELEVNVPPETNLVLKTSNGEVQVTGIEGDLEVLTSNGKVTARDGGRRKVRLETSNGAVVAEHLAGSIDARTSNGKVTVLGCPGKVDIQSSNGAVEVDSSGRAGDDISAHTSNGSVRCVLPGSFSGDVEAETSLGSVQCDFPLPPGSSDKHSLRGTIGVGGPRVRLKTSNGSIQVVRAST